MLKFKGEGPEPECSPGPGYHVFPFTKNFSNWAGTAKMLYF
jgi:hypothetical protein